MLSFLWQHREKSPLLTRRWFKSWAKRAWTFPALLGNEFRVWRLRWRGARIGAGSVFSPVQVSDARQLTVKENSFIGRVFLQAHAKIQIGSYVCINDGARLITASHDVLDPAWRQTEAAIVIDDYVWIATGAIILPGVRIGRGAVIGAGAVVSRDVPEFAVVIGNPAQIRPDSRTRTLTYSPTQFLAPFNAWLGSAEGRLDLK
jgi:maltose O-acetyltransferase